MRTTKSYLPELRILTEKLCAKNEPPTMSNQCFQELIELLKAHSCDDERIEKLEEASREIIKSINDYEDCR